MSQQHDMGILIHILNVLRLAYEKYTHAFWPKFKCNTETSKNETKTFFNSKN